MPQSIACQVLSLYQNILFNEPSSARALLSLPSSPEALLISARPHQEAMRIYALETFCNSAIISAKSVTNQSAPA